MPLVVGQATYSFVAQVRRSARPMALEPARRHALPMAQQQRAALSLPWRDETHRLIVIAWPNRRRVAAKSKASAIIQRSRFFCEHRSPLFAVQPEASGSGRLDPAPIVSRSTAPQLIKLRPRHPALRRVQAKLALSIFVLLRGWRCGKGVLDFRR